MRTDTAPLSDKSPANMHHVETIVVGAGQAGLAMGYWLQKRSLPFLILEAAPRLGTSWRSRYDSLVLFSPRRYSTLPGLLHEGDQQVYPTKDEMADYLERYAQTFALPICLQTPVEHLQKEGETFVLHTPRGIFHAKTVIVATGAFGHPSLPPFSKALSPAVQQIHAASYRRPAELPEGSVLVVGAGDSGAHIAAEVVRSHPVVLSASAPLRFVSLTLLGKSLFWYLDRLRLLEAEKTSRLGRWLLNQPEPILGFELKQAIERGAVSIKPRAISAQGGTVQFADGSQVQARTVIWATGYHQDWSWIQIPGVCDPRGYLVQQQGISAIPGLFFLGLVWQRSRGSSLVGWVGHDAKRLQSVLQAKEKGGSIHVLERI